MSLESLERPVLVVIAELDGETAKGFIETIPVSIGDWLVVLEVIGVDHKCWFEGNLVPFLSRAFAQYHRISAAQIRAREGNNTEERHAIANGNLCAGARAMRKFCDPLAVNVNFP